MNNILMALVCFAVMSGILGIILAVASKVFAVSTDERVEKITELLRLFGLCGVSRGDCSRQSAGKRVQFGIGGESRRDRQGHGRKSRDGRAVPGAGNVFGNA